MMISICFVSPRGTQTRRNGRFARPLSTLNLLSSARESARDGKVGNFIRKDGRMHAGRTAPRRQTRPNSGLAISLLCTS